jgi:hypothetical protein
MSDDKPKAELQIQRYSIAELEAHAASLSRADRREEANSLLAVAELRRMLVANAERDLAVAQSALRIDRLETICGGLEIDRDQAFAELRALRREHSTHLRLSMEMRDRLDIQAAIIDASVGKISAIAASIEGVIEP